MSSNKSFVFPYMARLEADGSVEVFPIARLLIKKKGEVQASLFLVIDSGATISALPKTDAVFFGKKAEGGIPMMTSGIGGISKGWIHNVEVYFGEMPLSIPLVFLDDENAPRVLGREGVFDKFNILFEENKQRTALLKTESLEVDSISKIIDSLVD